LHRSQNIIQSARLNLRELELHDAQFMLQLLNEAGFLKFIGDKGVRTLKDAREYILKGPIDSYRNLGFGLYLTSLRESAAPIGICGLVKREALPDVDVGFAFLARYPRIDRRARENWTAPRRAHQTGRRWRRTDAFWAAGTIDSRGDLHDSACGAL
jgi:hypothetical protein